MTVLPLFLLALAPGALAQFEPAIASTDVENFELVLSLTLVLLSFVFVAFICRVIIGLSQHMRHIACIANDKQRYFQQPNEFIAFLRKHVYSAPLWGKRHMREFRLGRNINLGFLPNRLQTLVIALYYTLNVIFCVIDLGYKNPEKEFGETLRDRTGVLAVFNMIPLFILSGRTNPLLELLQIPYDIFLLLHRWLGRLVALEAIAHTLSWLVVTIQKEGGWKVAGEKILTDPMASTGTAGVVVAILIISLAWKPVRSAAYEFFVYSHIVLAGALIGILWIHVAGFTSQVFLLPVILIWVVDRLLRFYNFCRRSLGSRSTSAFVEALPGEAVRVTLNLARPWKVQAGQYAFLTIPSVGLITNHPFSVAWASNGESQTMNPSYMEKALPPIPTQDLLATKASQISFIIRSRTGFTDKLYRKAMTSPEGRLNLRAFVEGPYGSQDMRSYGTVLLFAAGIGITHQVPHVRELVASYSAAMCATRKITLIWTVQSPEHLEWIRAWMTEILALPGRREVLKILLFVSRPRSTREIHSPSSSVQMFPGKPNIQELVDQEMQNAVGATAVSCCGTGSMSDDVREASRKWMGERNVTFINSSFGW